MDQLINKKQFNRKYSAQISSIDPLSTSQNDNDPDATITTTKSTTETLSYYRTPAKDELFLDSDSESEVLNWLLHFSDHMMFKKRKNIFILVSKD